MLEHSQVINRLFVAGSVFDSQKSSTGVFYKIDSRDRFVTGIVLRIEAVEETKRTEQ
jgi:hypothetical protein